ncbi:MAG TPA: hypothetical protein VE777_10345 [Gaiellales bacterium]|nr:hypothetical protein [Gaiellales bacterium]
MDVDRPWDPSHLELERPERVTMLEDWGPAAAGPTALSPVAITSPFRVLSDRGAETLAEICAALEADATSMDRIPKMMRGSLYRSAWMRGFYTDPRLVRFVSEIMQADIRPHPASHHAVHINFAPEDLGRHVDQWHRDSVSFDFVLLATDPAGMRGGRFQYFVGSVEEGRALLEAGPLPPERVRSVEFPAAGYAVLQQGHRVLHRAARLEAPHPRVTVVGSYWCPHPTIPDPTDLDTLLAADGHDVAVVEWSRYQAEVAIERLRRFAESGTALDRPVADVRADLAGAVAELEEAVAAFDRTDRGRAISFGDGDA